MAPIGTVYKKERPGSYLARPNGGGRLVALEHCKREELDIGDEVDYEVTGTLGRVDLSDDWKLVEGPSQTGPAARDYIGHRGDATQQRPGGDRPQDLGSHLTHSSNTGVELVLMDTRYGEVLILGDGVGKQYGDRASRTGRILDRDYALSDMNKFGVDSGRRLAQELGVDSDVVKADRYPRAGDLDRSVLSYAYAVPGNAYLVELEKVLRPLLGIPPPAKRNQWPSSWG
jgi:hypothetical protein